MRAVKARWVAAVGIMVVFISNSCATLNAQQAKDITDREACQRVQTLLPQAQGVVWPGLSLFGRDPKITGTRLTAAGFTISLDKKADISVAYADVQNVKIKGNVFVDFKMQGHDYAIEYDRSDVRESFAMALKRLAEAAHAERSVNCTGNVEYSQPELDKFTQQTAAWRAMATKPALSDEVIKKQLLAEDAVEHKNLRAAVTYYEAGVALDPTWAQGWFNAALLHAEQQDYFDAAVGMKHYLILLPDASDAVAAKTKVLLWEAKSEEGHK
jgi:hypothetical protein